MSCTSPRMYCACAWWMPRTGLSAHDRYPVTKSVPIHMCACTNVSMTLFFFLHYIFFFALYLPYVLLLLFKVPYTTLFSCVLKNALFERILKFTTRFFRVFTSNAIERPTDLFNLTLLMCYITVESNIQWWSYCTRVYCCTYVILQRILSGMRRPSGSWLDINKPHFIWCDLKVWNVGSHGPLYISDCTLKELRKQTGDSDFIYQKFKKSKELGVKRTEYYIMLSCNCLQYHRYCTYRPHFIASDLSLCFNAQKCFWTLWKMFLP